MTFWSLIQKLYYWTKEDFLNVGPTYPSPKPTLTFTSYLAQNVGLGDR